MMNNRSDIGNRIKQARKAQHLSQTELARQNYAYRTEI